MSSTSRQIARAAYSLYRFNRMRRIYKKYKTFTMMSERTYVNNLAIAHSFRRIPGCVVECGVWGGGMIAGLADVLGPNRDYFLFDSFEGLPPAKEIDGPAALRWQADTEGPGYYNNCKATDDEARAAMSLSAATRYSLVKGWFHETMPTFTPPQPIALLRLDADWYESTLTCLKHLYPHVAPGGVVIVDDYAAWDGCARAVHELLSERPLGDVLRIRQFANDVYYIDKPPRVLGSNTFDQPTSKPAAAG